ncbi:MAG: tRNA preQ1(34) S-adenosylmethionine ribosyltransferase-isomerase QueA [Spirochaetia bacterium]|nr:tRNA preQ1(34) S-adenosylmethionine ribosyltransferase-isomerase QueA [Spirochaetia bacterium]
MRSEKQEGSEILAAFDFDLPQELIATRPPAGRGQSRMLVVNTTTQTLTDAVVADLPRFLHAGDLLVFNETRVRQCRLRLKRRSGARVEAVFLESESDGSWECLLGNSSRIKEGETLLLEQGGDSLLFSVSFRDDAYPRLTAVRPDGSPAWKDREQAEDFFLTHGEMPIPPYMNRTADADDALRYQSIFAKNTGSAAAPTAGLHFTETLLEDLERARVDRAFVELNVGYGTFAPVTAEMIESRRLHKERYSIGHEAARQWADSRGRKIAVGTTTLRAVESCIREHGCLVAGRFSTSLFILPPDRPQSFDGLFTNFHLPRSSLFALVCAFGGTELIQKAYAHAVTARYRFYSYGDAMLII